MDLCLAELFPSCTLWQGINLFLIPWATFLYIEARNPSLSLVQPPFINLKGCFSSREEQQIMTSLVPPQSTGKGGKVVSHIPPDPHLSPLLSVLFSSPSASFSKFCLHLHSTSDGKSFPQGSMTHCPRKKQRPWQQQLLSSACPLEPGNITWFMASSWSG